MGFVYYGNYATYLEVARVEALRSLGISYQNLEEQQVFLPVVHYSIDYKAPAHYDDELTITTVISEMPSVKITFDYEVHRGEYLLCQANTVLVFMNEQNKPMRCPEYLSSVFKPHF
jgi:acyl-CoA thioester hydrolase